MPRSGSRRSVAWRRALAGAEPNVCRVHALARARHLLLSVPGSPRARTVCCAAGRARRRADGVELAVAVLAERGELAIFPPSTRTPAAVAGRKLQIVPLQ